MFIKANTLNTLIPICFLAVCVFSLKCKTRTNKPVLFDRQLVIDTLLAQHHYDSVIRIANRVLSQLPDSGSGEARLFLYNVLSVSHKQFVFDSAVYYAEKAYDQVVKARNGASEALAAATLFSLYNRVRDTGKQYKMLPAIKKYAADESWPPVTRALLFDAIGGYYAHNNTGDNRDLTIFYSLQALEQNEKYLRSNPPSHDDSFRLGICYLHLVTGYTHFNFTEKNEQSIYYLSEAKKWIPEDRFAKAYLYNTLVLWHCFYEVDISLAKRYADRVEQLAKAPGENLWDLVLDSYILLADHYYYRTAPDYKTSWQYARLARKYDSRGLNPYYTVCINWLVGDLYLKEGNYEKSLGYYSLAMNQDEYLTNTNHSLLQIANIRNLGNLGMLDSFNLYLDKYEQQLEKVRRTEEEDDVEKFKVLNQARLRTLKIKEQTLELEYEHKRLFAVIAILISVVIITLLLYINYKQKNKAAALLNIRNRELSQLNEALNEANDTKSKLFGIISHDLRSPVAQLYQLLKLQQAGSTLISEDERAALETRTRRTTANLLEGMEDLLLWSKSQLQAFSARLEPADVYDVLHSALQILSLQMQSKSLLVENNVPRGSIVNTDPNMLSTILRNLIQNAIKASPARGTIRISYRSDAEASCGCFIRITNKGVPFTQQDYMNALEKSRTSGLLSGGWGFQIIEELSRKINIHVFFEETGPGETSCTLCFNYGFQSLSGPRP